MPVNCEKTHLCLCISKCSRKAKNRQTDKKSPAEREKEVSHLTTCGAKSASDNQFTHMINFLFKVAVLVAGLSMSVFRVFRNFESFFLLYSAVNS